MSQDNINEDTIDETQNNQGGTEDGVEVAEEQVHSQTDLHDSDTAGQKAAAQTTAAGSDQNQIEEQVADLTADLQRLQAEFTNYKRRETEAKAGLLDMAKRDVIMQVLPVLDNIERALAHRPDELKDNAWAGGVESVGKQSLDALKKLGVERIESVGQPFDHNLHEAISMEDGDGEHEVVTEELQAGYKLGDVVIRHAMVKVGKQ